MSDDQYRNGDVERRMENICRIGVVAEANYTKARLRIQIGDITTDWLPWVTHRAGQDSTWWAPDVGEQVLVLAPSGVLEDAVVLGSIYQNAHPAPDTNNNVHVTKYADGTRIAYDRSLHRLEVQCVGDVNLRADGKVVVNSDGAVTVQAAQSIGIQGAGVSITDTGGGGCQMSGKFTLNGDLTVNGKINSTGNIHSAGVISDSDGDGGA